MSSMGVLVVCVKHTVLAVCSCRFVAGKVFVGHVKSTLTVYHKDECKLWVTNMAVCMCVHMYMHMPSMCTHAHSMNHIARPVM